MNERKRQEQLRVELQKSEGRMQNCTHDFNETLYDPKTVKEGYGMVQDGGGSDPHWGYEGYRDVKKDRWSRECKKCGKKEYTDKLEPVVKAYEPRFYQ